MSKNTWYYGHSLSHLVPAEAEPHEDEKCLGTEQTRLVGAEQRHLSDGGSKELPPLSVDRCGVLHSRILQLFDFVDLLLVPLDPLEKGLDVGVDVDDLVSEQHHDPARLEGQPPQLIGGAALEGGVAHSEPEHDPVLDGGQGQVSARSM